MWVIETASTIQMFIESGRVKFVLTNWTLDHRRCIQSTVINMLTIQIVDCCTFPWPKSSFRTFL